MIKQTSLTNGVPLTGVPLGFVLGISMIREGIEDYARYKSDLEVPKCVPLQPQEM